MRPIKMSFYTALLSADGKTLKMLDPKGHQVASLNFGKEIKFQTETSSSPKANLNTDKKDGHPKPAKTAKNLSNTHANTSQRDVTKEDKKKTFNSWKELKTQKSKKFTWRIILPKDNYLNEFKSLAQNWPLLQRSVPKISEDGIPKAFITVPKDNHEIRKEA
jgi:hypothetical protein